MKRIFSKRSSSVPGLISINECTNLLYSLVIPLGITLITHVYLKATGPIVFILACIVAVELLFFIQARIGPVWSTVTRCILLGFFMVSAILILLLAIMVPFPVYKAWLATVGEQSAGGNISFLFVLGAGYFASVFAGSVYTRGRIEPLLGFGFVLSLLVTVLYQAWVFALFDIVLLASYIVCILVRRKRGNVRTLAYAGFSLVVVILFSAVAATLFRFDNGWFVNTSLYPDLKKLVVDSLGGSSFVSSLAGYGYSFDQENLGGKPILSTQPVFIIEAEPGSTVYLRSAAFDNYDTNRWLHSVDPADVKTENPTIFNNRSVASEGNIEVTVVLDYYPSIPHTLSVNGLYIPQMGKPDVMYGNLDLCFILTLPLIRDNRVVIHEGEPARPVQKKMLSILETNLGMHMESQVYDIKEGEADYLAPYLFVRDFLKDEIKEIARESSDGNGRETYTLPEWRKLRNIYLYLASHYGFSLDTKEPVNDRDLVADFLLVTKKGYSVHFATSFVMLARMSGIPARYVTGFLAVLPEDANKVTISGYNAHVWAEVWLAGPGWVSVETCPFMDSRFLRDPDYYRRFNPDNDAETERQLAAFMGNKLKPPDKKITSNGLKPAVIKAGIVIAVVIPAILFVLFLLRFIKHRVPLRGNAKKVYSIGLRLVRRYRGYGVTPPVETGWREWQNTMEKRLPSKSQTLRGIVLILEKAFYAASQPTDDDVLELKAGIEELRRRKDLV